MSTTTAPEWSESPWPDALTPALVGSRVRVRMVDDDGAAYFTAAGLLVVVRTEATTVETLAGYHTPASAETRVVLTRSAPGDVDTTLTLTADMRGYVEVLES